MNKLDDVVIPPTSISQDILDLLDGKFHDVLDWGLLCDLNRHSVPLIAIEVVEPVDLVALFLSGGGQGVDSADGATGRELSPS